MDAKNFVFGARPVLEAIDADKNIDKIFMKRDLTGEVAREIAEKAKEYDIPVIKVPVDKLNRITMKNHQGIIAVLTPVRYHKLENIVPELFEEGKNPLALMLDGVTDARNFGSIARTAECAGVNFIVIPERGNASVTADAMKASAGAFFHIPVCRVKDNLTALKYLKECGYSVTAASEKAKEDYTEVDFTIPSIIVMGAEDTGISNEILRICDNLASIPIMGRIGSLNVGVAAGIMLYQAIYQRLKL